MPFGIKNALAKFQKVMDKILLGLNFVHCYINDIIIFSVSMRQHEVFQCLQTHELKFHLGKCKFIYDWIEYLGHMMYLGGLKVQQTKVDVIAHIPHPMDVSQVQGFMGLANNYQ